MSNPPEIDMFQSITYKIIRIHAPKMYHTSDEWEYESNDNGESEKLRVWLDDERNDEPFVYKLNKFESRLVDKAVKQLENLEWNCMD